MRASITCLSSRQTRSARSARRMLPIGIMQANKDSRNDDKRIQRAMQEANALPQTSIVDIDPEVPSQLLDDAGQFSVMSIDVDAQPDAEAEADMDAATETADAEDIETPSE